MKSKIDIIIRTNNREIFLKRSLKSINNQSFKDFLIYIVNDRGDVNSVKNVINKFDTSFISKITIIDNRDLISMDALLNLGILNSSSEFIHIHDDDDTLDPLFYEKMLNGFEKYPLIFHVDKIYGLCSNTVIIDEKVVDDKIVSIGKTYIEAMNHKSNRISKIDLLIENSISPISFIFRRETIEKTGLFKNDLIVAGDWEFFLRFIKVYEIFTLKEDLAFWHIRRSIIGNANSYVNSVILGNDSIYPTNHTDMDIKLKNEWLFNQFLGDCDTNVIIIHLFNRLKNHIDFKLENLEIELRDSKSNKK